MNVYSANDTTLIDVACKTGVTSIKTSFAPWNPLAQPQDQIQNIVCVVRNPQHRLLSAWRMYFEGPSIKYLYRGEDTDFVRDARYIRSHAQNIVNDPLRYWRQFLAHSLGDYQTDPHFAPQWREYRRFYLNYPHKIRLHKHDRLDQLFAQYGQTPVQVNHQKWRWSIDPKVFIQAIPKTVFNQYYTEDTILWGRVDK